MWDVQENRQYTTFIKIDGVDLSENLIDMNISFDLDGSSVSSIFGSVLRYNIEFELFDNIEGKVIDIDFGYYVGDYMDEPTYDIKNFGQFKIIEFEYDEKLNTTKMKAETDLSNLDDDFSLQTLPNEPSENLIPNSWDSFVPYGTEGKETRAPLEVFEDGYNRNYLLNSDVMVDFEEQDVTPTKVGEYLPTDGGRNLIPNSGVTKQFTEQVPKPQINSDFDLEQVLTLKCYFKIQLGDLI